MYPLTLPQTWQSVDTLNNLQISPETRDWIATESSLTVRVKELGIAFSVQVLNQQVQHVSAVHQQLLGNEDSQATVREVLLKQGDTALVYAQTIMPDSTLTGTESMLSQLGNQSLGQVLFQSPQAIRGQIEFAQVAPDSELGQYIQQQLNQPITQACYIRRSVFQLNNKPLLVCECFLPALFK